MSEQKHDDDAFGPYTKTLYTIARIYDIGTSLLDYKPSRWQRIKFRLRRLLRHL